MGSTEVRHGSCLCRAIKYELKGDPFAFIICHCVNCRKVSGSAYMSNCFYKPKNVVITQGEDSIKSFRDTETESGRILVRWFCTTCGSSLFMSNDNNDFRIATAGTIDSEIPWTPRGQMFPECLRTWTEGIKALPESKAKAKL